MEDNAESDFLEISVLKSIYGDDLVVERTENGRDGGLSVEMKVQPLQMNNCSTASLHIKFLLSDNYPAQPPKILLLQPRGIDDKNLNALNAKLDEYLNNNLGAEVLYDLMQLTQTFIEKFQATPSALCPICLCDFSTKQPSLCTSCEHFVHTCCFASYIRYSKAEIEKQLNEWPSDMKYKVDQTLRCPVCRLELNETEYSCELNKEDCEGSKDNEDFDFDWGSWKHLQEELNVIYERQLRNGGIIDLEKEKQKNMVTEDTFVTVSKARTAATESGSHGRENELDTCKTADKFRRNGRMDKAERVNSGSWQFTYNANCSRNGRSGNAAGNSYRPKMKNTNFFPSNSYSNTDISSSSSVHLGKDLSLNSKFDSKKKKKFNTNK